MNQTGEFFMVHERNELSDRLSAFFRGKGYGGPGGPKMLAREIDVTPRTALNYINSYWPGALQWRSIVRTFGREVVSAVFDPEIDETEARLAAEVRELEAKLEARKAVLRSVAGRQTRVAEAAE